MTQHQDPHTDLTAKLIAAVDRGRSWLDHRDAAGELDWALLRGATLEELRQIRADVLGHVRHLRTTHHIVVEEGPAGYYRMTGVSRPPVGAPRGDGDAPRGEEDADDEAYDEVGADVVAGIEATPQRFFHAARALVALHQAGELANPMHKAAVGMVIRQASECNHWHNSAHFRSRAAGELIAREIAQSRIATAAQYQAFCRQNLRHEHMVPNSVIYRMILDNPNPTVDWIVGLFNSYSRRATITRDEDRRLLASEMPAGFYKGDDPWFKDAFARYRQAELYDQLVPRPASGMWFPPG